VALDRTQTAVYRRRLGVGSGRRHRGTGGRRWSLPISTSAANLAMDLTPTRSMSDGCRPGSNGLVTGGGWSAVTEILDDDHHLLKRAEHFTTLVYSISLTVVMYWDSVSARRATGGATGTAHLVAVGHQIHISLARGVDIVTKLQSAI
jgi:hypothetical protein